MLIIGAGGFALQLFDDLVSTNNKDIVLWSETECRFDCLKEHFRILSTDQEAKDYFNEVSRSFVTGIWNVDDRKSLTKRFLDLGGEPGTLISPFTDLSSYTTVGRGSIVLWKAASEPYVQIGENCIINKQASFGHGCKINEYCSIGPHALIASNSEIGESSYIGMRAIIQPKVKIGKNVTVAAGAVVTKNIPNNAVVAGQSAEIRFFKKNQSI
jgi:sugar O-acyltransferase (sialic acid O-acetyltransferase NeuD family)